MCRFCNSGTGSNLGAKPPRASSTGSSEQNARLSRGASRLPLLGRPRDAALAEIVKEVDALPDLEHPEKGEEGQDCSQDGAGYETWHASGARTCVKSPLANAVLLALSVLSTVGATLTLWLMIRY